MSGVEDLQDAAEEAANSDGAEWWARAGFVALGFVYLIVGVLALQNAQLVPTEWVLLDVRIHALRNGFGHGDVHLWADDGTLLATASQSTIVRYWKEDVPGTNPRGTGSATRD